MRFTVPQFIEHEAKIVGPLTFKQFIYVGFGAAVSFILYVYIGPTNFSLFLILTIVIMSAVSAFAFLKVGGRPLPIAISNFFLFLLSPRIYLWKKKEAQVRVFKKPSLPATEVEKKTPTIRVAGESQLRKLSAEVETKKN